MNTANLVLVGIVILYLGMAFWPSQRGKFSRRFNALNNRRQLEIDILRSKGFTAKAAKVAVDERAARLAEAIRSPYWNQVTAIRDAEDLLFSPDRSAEAERVAAAATTEIANAVLEGRMSEAMGAAVAGAHLETRQTKSPQKPAPGRTHRPKFSPED